MRFEGIHHVTCITGDAPGNVDFYTRVLGLRMVKKTVNQDDPTVYHLFYADEAGSPGADITFFEYPGARRGRAGAGMVHTISFRVGSEETLDFWEARLGAEGIATDRSAGRLRFDDPEGLGLELAVVDTSDAPLTAEHPEVPAEHALRGFDSVRAFTATPEASRELLETTLGFTPTGEQRVGGARRGARRPLRLRPAAGLGRRHPRRRHGAPRRLGLEHGRAGGMARSRASRRRPRERDHRPVLVPLDLLPRAERGAVRDRDHGAGLLDRRGRRAPRRDADPAACVRAPAGADRARPDPAPRPTRRLDELVTLELHSLERPAEGTPEGALVLFHGRGADERDLYPLLDALDPERRLLGITPRGPLALPPGGAHWYRLGGIPTPDPSTFFPSFEAAGALLDGLPVPIERVVIGGFSQGAVMSWALGLGAGRPRPAAIIALSGFMPEVEGFELDLSDLDGYPVAVAHGSLDPVIPVEFGRAAAERVRAAGADLLWRETPVPHTIDPRVLPELQAFVAAATR